MGAEPYSGKPRVGVEDLVAWIESGVPSYADIAENFRTSDDQSEVLTKRPLKDFQEDLLVDMENYEVRERNAAEVGYVIPCREALDEIAKHGPLLEVGAGTGYWAALIAKAGVDIVATDLKDGSSLYPVEFGTFHEVLEQDAEEAVLENADRNLLIIYPSMGLDWAARAARALSPGRVLIYIGEVNGCCADDSFFALLSKEFENVRAFKVPRVSKFNEAMFVFRKKA